MNYSATDLSTKSGEILDTAQREPVRIVKHGRDYAFIISSQEMEEVKKAQQYLKLKSAVQDGFSQIERGEFSTRSMSEIGDEVIRRAEERKKNKN